MYAKLTKKKLNSIGLNPNLLVVLVVLLVCVVVYQFAHQNSQIELQSLSRKDPASAATFTPGLQLYVSPTGSDSNNGRSASSAFRTLVRARDEIRAIKKSPGLPTGGIAVNIAGGTYENASVSLDANDSGTVTAPIAYRSTPGQVARLMGGKMIPASSLTGGTIKQVSLGSVGVTAIAPLTARNSGYDGKAPTELFFGGKRMTIAQYPNAPTWAYTTGDPDVMTDGFSNYKCGESTFDCATVNGLSGTSGLFLHTWSRDYASIFEPVTINSSARRLTVSGPWIELSGERRFRVLNAKSLVDVAGEYFIDRSTNTLHFYPPAALSNQEIYLSTNENIFKLSSASNIRIEDLMMESAYGQLIDVTLGSNIQILGNTMRNSGENAVLIQGGSNNLVQSNDMYDLGEGGVQLRENAATKTAAVNNTIINNHIYKFSQVQMSYRQGIKMVGNGNRAAYNKVHDTPNMAIWIQGNNNILEYNEVFDAVKESGDTAPFHTGGLAGTTGNEVRYNYFHDIDPNQFRKTRGQELCEASTGIYLDDNTSNFRVYGNIVYNPGIRGVFINNGNNNKIENNIFLGSKYGVFLQYRYWTEPAPPKGNVIQNNANYNVEVALTPPNRSVECDNASWQTNMFKDNTIQNANGGAVLNSDPGIVDPVTKQLKNGTSSSIQSALPSFQRIPIECIGNYNDEYRSDSNRNSICGQVVTPPVRTPAPTPVTTVTPVQTAPPVTAPPVTAPPVSAGPQTPYRSVNIPGTIQAEEFDNGGKNVAYFDTTTGSQLQGVSFRQDTDVDIEPLPLALLAPGANSYSVSWAAAGEYLKYTFTVPIAGSYIIKPRVASNGPGGTYRLKIDTSALSTLTVPDTAGWQKYVDQTSAPVQLRAGSHVLTVEMLTNGSQPSSTPAIGNFDYFKIESVGPTRIEAENYSATGGYWTIQGAETVPGVLKTATYIYRFDPRDWVKYSGITLTGKTRIDFNIAPRTVGGIVEIRIGSSTGPLIGTLKTVNADSTLTKYSVQSATLTPTTGVQDLYLVGTNTYEVGRIDWFEIK